MSTYRESSPSNRFPQLYTPELLGTKADEVMRG
ncbi:hypothetical protein EYZ11_004517 [Aspergillus tanneri]|uniref:Uncharacterized protein n=1 Tax=Aspergillus tanneri TaxID=1220188 RepID=A0A4S3JMQ4_9EURO|nr:hypothetical protein EYZ11_004517 [Aspergillus tanneri]